MKITSAQFVETSVTNSSFFFRTILMRTITRSVEKNLNAQQRVDFFSEEIARGVYKVTKCPRGNFCYELCPFHYPPGSLLKLKIEL